MRQPGGLGPSANDRILQLALEHVPLGVSVWDEDKKLRFANDRYLEIYDFAPENVPPGLTLEGMAKLTVASENHPGAKIDNLVDVFRSRLDVARATGKPVRTEKAIRGRLIATNCIFSAGLGWIVLHDDITEQTEQKWQAALTEKNLDTQNRRFNAAIDNMSHGLVIFDANMRVVVCNQGYRDIYRLTGEVRSGTHLRRIAEQRVAAGTQPAGIEDFVAFCAQVQGPTERFVKTSQLHDGRYIEVTRSPIDTGGYVAVHKDVTEEIARLDAIKASNTELALYKRRFDAALANMSHGLSLYDADWCLVACNARYLELYSLSEANIKPGTPFSEIIRQRKEAGAVPVGMDGDFEGHVLATSDPLARQVQTYRLGTGRVIQVAQSPVEGGGFVAIHQDITEQVESLDALKASHAELAVQTMRFEAALANISHGLSMYDSDGRLVIANERYREIYRAPPEALNRGNRYTDLVARRDGPNGFQRITESNELVTAVMGEATSAAETIEAYRLGDGRVVSILQSAMPDGGFIRTHQDITRQVQRFEQLQQAERAAAEQNEMLTRQNIRFDAAINNMSQGLCMFDSDARLVVCNERYALIYNLPPELMRAGTTLEQILEHRFATV